TGDHTLLDRAARTLERYGQHVGRAVRVMPLMVANVALWHGGDTQVVVAGGPDAADTLALERAVAAHYLPWAVSVPIDPATAEHRAATMPWVAAMVADQGAAAYICDGFACQAPESDPAAVAASLDALVQRTRVALI